jgi:hypothetical protein
MKWETDMLQAVGLDQVNLAVASKHLHYVLPNTAVCAGAQHEKTINPASQPI